jgi:hypothetical protein
LHIVLTSISNHYCRDATLHALAPDGELQPRLCDGTATLTTHRLLWFGQLDAAPISVAIALWRLREVRASPGGRWKASNKIQLWAAGQSADESVPAATLALKSGRDELLTVRKALAITLLYLRLPFLR